MQKNKVFIVLTAALFIFAAVGLSAQSMEIIDDLLGQESANFGESVYMITVGGGIVDESASISEAMEAASEKKWIRSKTSADDTITLGEVSLLTMKALKIRGGLMYKLFPTPRYAVRELAYLEIFRGEAHPNNEISGEDVVKLLSQAISWKEDK